MVSSIKLLPGQYLKNGAQTFKITPKSSLGLISLRFNLAAVTFPVFSYSLTVTGTDSYGKSFVKYLTYNILSSMPEFKSKLLADFLTLFPGYSPLNDSLTPTSWLCDLEASQAVPALGQIFSVTNHSGTAAILVPINANPASTTFRGKNTVGSACCVFPQNVVPGNSWLSTVNDLNSNIPSMAVPETVDTNSKQKSAPSLIAENLTTQNANIKATNLGLSGVVVGADTCNCCLTVLTSGTVGIHLVEPPALTTNTGSAFWLYVSDSQPGGFYLSQLTSTGAPPTPTGFEMVDSVKVHNIGAYHATITL